MALERQLSGAARDMGDQITVDVESFAAGLANEWFLSRVNSHVCLQRAVADERLVAGLALEMMRAVLDFDVVEVVRSTLELERTLLTADEHLFVVETLVLLPRRSGAERFSALVTVLLEFARVGPQMALETFPICVTTATFSALVSNRLILFSVY